MRVLICPDKFAGTLNAVQAAAAIADGWRRVAPADELVCRPLSDGGPGFLDVIEAALGDGSGPLAVGPRRAGLVGGARVTVPACDPLGRPVPAQILLAGETAYLESAQVCGLHLVEPERRDPKATTSYGLGLLLLAAVEHGARSLVVGLGGSATNDAGAGALAALDAAPLDGAGYALPYGGAALLACAGLGGTPRLRGAALVAATDVDNPLTGRYGASAVYGPQKGASHADVVLLDAALARFADVCERELPGCPPGLANLAGGGAAGGIGAMIFALGGRRESGIGLVRRLTGLDEAVAGADLVITGEGSFDEQSLRGKVIAGVAAAARDQAVPCLVLAGRSSAGRREAAVAGVTGTHTLVDHFGSVEEAMRRPAEGLSQLAARLARQWRPPNA